MTRLPHVFFAATCLLIALVSLRWLMLPLAEAMPNMAHFLQDAPLTMWGHLVFAPLALALAPFQISAALRARRPGLHRAMGYTYALSVAIAAMSSLIFAPHSVTSTFARAGFMVLAVLWLAFTGLGIAFARRRDFNRHLQWMRRSIALTYAAVTLRIVMAPLMAMGWTVGETYDVTAWGSWLLNLALLEWWLRRGQAGKAQLA